VPVRRAYDRHVPPVNFSGQSPQATVALVAALAEASLSAVAERRSDLSLELE
jgi:hypothetical protein